MRQYDNWISADLVRWLETETQKRSLKTLELLTGRLQIDKITKYDILLPDALKADLVDSLVYGALLKKVASIAVKHPKLFPQMQSASCSHLANFNSLVAKRDRERGLGQYIVSKSSSAASSAGTTAIQFWVPFTLVHAIVEMDKLLSCYIADHAECLRFIAWREGGIDLSPTDCAAHVFKKWGPVYHLKDSLSKRPAGWRESLIYYDSDEKLTFQCWSFSFQGRAAGASSERAATIIEEWNSNGLFPSVSYFFGTQLLSVREKRADIVDKTSFFSKKGAVGRFKFWQKLAIWKMLAMAYEFPNDFSGKLSDVVTVYQRGSVFVKILTTIDKIPECQERYNPIRLLPGSAPTPILGFNVADPIFYSGNKGVMNSKEIIGLSVQSEAVYNAQKAAGALKKDTQVAFLNNAVLTYDSSAYKAALAAGQQNQVSNELFRVISKYGLKRVSRLFASSKISTPATEEQFATDSPAANKETRTGSSSAEVVKGGKDSTESVLRRMREHGWD